MIRTKMAAVAALALAAGACLGPARSSRSGDDYNSRYVVTAEEIANSGAMTAWEALRLLGAVVRLEEDKDQEPARITARGRSSINLSSEPLVFLDGVRLGEYRVLHSMGAHLVERIEFVAGPQASIDYGTNAGHGVILITTRSTLE